MAGGAVERRLVGTGAHRLYMLGRHRTGAVDADLILFRSGSPLRFGSLSAARWGPHVRTEQEFEPPELGHVDLFQLGREHRIGHAFTAG